MLKVVIAGAGIGGLASALACARAGAQVQVLEQASELREVGAGIQLGPNAVRRLADWGLLESVQAVAGHPVRLEVRDARTQRLLGGLALGARARERYGADYLTVHRADLQSLLHRAVLGQSAVSLRLGQAVHAIEPAASGLRVVSGPSAEGPSGDDRMVLPADLAVVADGVWSRLRASLVGDGPPRRIGHIALRTLLDTDAVPEGVARDAVTAWLGPRMHAVAYPVCAGRRFNFVLIVHEGERLALDDMGDRWNGAVDAARVHAAVIDAHPVLRELVRCAPEWKFWALHGRTPMRGAHEMVQGRVALVGDAAHPMVPYLAQGAVMAIEDAHALGRAVQGLEPADVAVALTRWADVRWPRASRVQTRSLRNGRIFHARGLMRLGRDGAMALLGEPLLDLPWLYGG